MIRLAVHAPAERAELVLAALLELAPAGVEQIDRGGMTEFAIYGAPGELPDLGGQRAALGGVEVEVRSTEVGDDWSERWKEFHRPVLIAQRLRVRPPWSDPVPGLEDIVIDPGRAFGTAAHPTTRMCCELLLEAAEQGAAADSLADLGTGSGVLAILARRLGWEPVIAVDQELAAIEAAKGNAERNSAAIELRRLDLRREPPPAAGTVVANLTADLLRALAERLEAGDSRPELLICSGVLAEQAVEVSDCFAAAGLREVDRREQRGWAALRLAG